MLLLTTAAHPTIVDYRDRPGGRHLGRLLTPRHYSSAAATSAAGIPWAADNDGYNGVDFDAYERMLDAIRDLPGCLFVTAPDVVADAAATDELWPAWAKTIRRVGHRPALVLQNGHTADTVPYADAGALFIGGDDAFKLGPDVRAILRRAHARHPGLHAHMGRVNSHRRILYAAQIGCDSVDGTGYAQWRKARLPDGLVATANASGGRPLAFDV